MFSCKTPEENACKVSRFLIKDSSSITIQLINRYELNTCHVPNLGIWKNKALSWIGIRKSQGHLYSKASSCRGEERVKLIPPLPEVYGI